MTRVYRWHCWCGTQTTADATPLCTRCKTVMIKGRIIRDSRKNPLTLEQQAVRAHQYVIGDTDA